MGGRVAGGVRELMDGVITVKLVGVAVVIVNVLFRTCAGIV